MTAITSGLHFLSGIALHLGTVPAWKIAKPSTRRMKRRQQTDSRNHKPLSERQKAELLESIRRDDWFE